MFDDPENQFPGETEESYWRGMGEAEKPKRQIALLPEKAGPSNSMLLQCGWLIDRTLCFFPSHAAISTMDIHDHLLHWRTRTIFNRYYKTKAGGWSKLFPFETAVKNLKC